MPEGHARVYLCLLLKLLCSGAIFCGCAKSYIISSRFCGKHFCMSSVSGTMLVRDMSVPFEECFGFFSVLSVVYFSKIRV